MINELEEMDADLETMVKILPEINKMPFRLYCNRMKKYVDDIPEDVLKICPTRPCDTCSQKERIDEEKFNSEIRMSNKNFE
ncbi:MAG: hypothetical protein MUP55_01485 [Candidatus Aenigmarchaeota archaeon]|nr:hypothetical protein [Candidatus Aenigmarchaeota archaeon]